MPFDEAVPHLAQRSIVGKKGRWNGIFIRIGEVVLCWNRDSGHRYLESSRGRWQGTTPFVDTTDFTGRVAICSNGAGDPGYHSEDLRVVERFMRTGGRTLQYEAIVGQTKGQVGLIV